jgi:uncharacterized membrane protein YeaQ/YmgE (transglycosylase-associated protein family)
MLDILGWVFFGLLVGIIAKAIMPGKDPGGVLITIVLGVVGSLIGGFIGRALFSYGTINNTGQMSRPGFLMSLALAVVGAIVLLIGYRLITRRSLRA